jgi:hypothetical protein
MFLDKETPITPVPDFVTQQVLELQLSPEITQDVPVHYFD